MVDVGFVPGFEALELLHDRVFRRNNIRMKDTRAVPQELSADQIDISLRLPPARGRTMDRHKPSSLLNVINERLLLIGRPSAVIRVDD